MEFNKVYEVRDIRKGVFFNAKMEEKRNGISKQAIKFSCNRERIRGH